MILSDLGIIVTGKTPSTKKPEFWNGNIPFVTPKDIQGTKHILSTERKITSFGLNSVKGAILPKGAICVSCIGNIGYVGKTITNCVSNQQINSIVPSENTNSDYVFYLMKWLWPYFKNYEGQSTALSILNKSQFSKIEIPCHSRKQQDDIANILNNIDDRIELNNAINNNLHEQAQAIFDLFYEKSSKHCYFTDLISVFGGGTPKTGNPDFWNGDIPFFTPKDIASPYTFRTEKYISNDGLAHCNSRLYPENTTFVTARGTVGKVCLAGLPMAMNQSCYALISRSIDPILVYFYVLKTVVALKHKATGAVFDAIITRDFETEKIAVLTGRDMQQILAIIKPIMKLIHLNAEESMKLVSIRDSLLPKLMSGELDVSDIKL